MYVRMFLPICSRTWRRQGQRHTRASRGLQTPTRRPVMDILTVVMTPSCKNLKKIKTHLPGDLSFRNITPSDNPAAKSSFIGFNLSGNPTIWRENHLQSRQDMILQRKMSSSKKSTHSNYHQCPISHLSRSSVHHLLWMADWILAQPSTFSITDHK